MISATILHLHLMVIGAVSVVPVPSPPPLPPLVEPGTLQSLEVVEVMGAPACPKVLQADGRLCGAPRRRELRRADRDRALRIINAGTRQKACRQPATHAFVARTTKGPVVVEVQLACQTIGGQVVDDAIAHDAVLFLRGQGLVTGLPPN